MTRQLLIRLVIILVVAFCGWWFWPYLLSSSTQASRQQEQLFKKAGHQDWKNVALLVAADYKDGVGMNKEEALQTAKELLEPFLIVNFAWTQSNVTVDGKKATLIGTLHMTATGPSGSSMVTNRVNQVHQPWTFTWRKEGWSFDSWRLISVSNPEFDRVAP